MSVQAVIQSDMEALGKRLRRSVTPDDHARFDPPDRDPVALLDELAPRVRRSLARDAAQMPLACVLEGGTWAAGRVLANELRGGLPPLDIASDGTVF